MTTETTKLIVRGVPPRLRGAGGRFASAPVEERFWAKVDRRDDDSCWPCLAATNNGYGIFSPDGFHVVRAHRFAYELLVGPIPSGLTLDHLCRNRPCVNPTHLEPVTRGENVLRGVSPAADHARRKRCLRGHLLSGENLHIYRRPNGREVRVCRSCVREREQRRVRA